MHLIKYKNFIDTKSSNVIFNDKLPPPQFCAWVEKSGSAGEG